MTHAALPRLEVPPPRVTPALLLLLSANGLRVVVPPALASLSAFPSGLWLLVFVPPAIATLLFAALAVHAVRQLARTAPVLVVDDLGVTDGITQVRYPWSAITAVSTWRGRVRLRLEGRFLATPVGAWHPLAPSRAVMARIEAGIVAARASERAAALQGIRIR